MQIIYPPKLKKWDNIRVIAPARSLALIDDESVKYAITHLQTLGLNISFWKHVYEMDNFSSSSISSRIDDLHDAFLDKNIHGIFTVIGGYNSDQLLEKIDYDIIKNNPKILCGFSDITALSNAIFAKTGLVWYSWPHFSSWWMKKWFEYTQEYFEKCCMTNNDYQIVPSWEWSDDAWYMNQEKREFIKNEWYWIIHKWEAEGVVLWWHSVTFNALFGTEFMPKITENIIIFYENDWEFIAPIFDKNLQSLVRQPWFSCVKGMVIGRFQKNIHMTRELLVKIIESKPQLQNIPIIGNVDFGHTTPFFTFPIGWRVYINSQNTILKILQH